MNFYQKLKLNLISFYPTLWFAGIRIKRKRVDGILEFRSYLKLNFFTKGVKGTYFGGSAFSMVDPFHMLILMDHLGSDYIVWDRKSSIKFIKPSGKRLEAHLKITREEIDHIKAKVAAEADYNPEFTIQIHDREGLLVAEVIKTLYVRKVKNETS